MTNNAADEGQTPEAYEKEKAELRKKFLDLLRKYPKFLKIANDWADLEGRLYNTAPFLYTNESLAEDLAEWYLDYREDLTTLGGDKAEDELKRLNPTYYLEFENSIWLDCINEIRKDLRNLDRYQKAKKGAFFSVMNRIETAYPFKLITEEHGKLFKTYLHNEYKLHTIRRLDALLKARPDLTEESAPRIAKELTPAYLRNVFRDLDIEIKQEIDPTYIPPKQAQDQIETPEEIIHYATRGQKVYLGNSKITRFLPLSNKHPQQTLDGYVMDYDIKMGKALGGTEPKVQITITFPDEKTKLTPYDELIEAAIGTIIINNLKEGVNVNSIKIAPKEIYRILADYKNHAKVSDAAEEEIINIIEKLRSGKVVIKFDKLQKAWNKDFGIKGAVLSGCLFPAHTWELIGEDGKKNVIYVPDGMPQIFKFDKEIIKQAISFNRGDLDTSAEAVKGLKDPEGNQIEPLRKTKDNVLITIYLYKELNRMIYARDNGKPFPNRLYYDVIKTNCYGNDTEDKPTSVKSDRTFRKNIDHLLTIWTAQGKIKGWTHYKDGTKHVAVDIELPNPVRILEGDD